MKKIFASQEELGIYLSCLEDTLAYNLPMLLSVDQVGAAKVESSLQILLSLHKQWNTRFALDEDGALVKYIADEPLVFSSSQVKAVDKDNLVRLFTLLDAPLYRFEFYQTPEGNYLFADSTISSWMDSLSIDSSMIFIASWKERKSPARNSRALKMRNARRLTAPTPL